MPSKSRIRGALVVTALAAVAIVPTALGEPGSPVSGPPQSLCGVSRALDDLLGCARQPASAGAPAQAPAASAPAPQLAAAAPVPRSATQATYEPNVLLVRFRPGEPRARIDALLTRLGVHAAGRIPQIGVRVLAVKASQRDRVRAELAASPLVVSADRDEVMQTMGVVAPNDAFFSYQWGLKLAGFPTAGARTHSSRPVVVAVVDTGVDVTQPDLAGVVLPGVNLVSPDAAQTDDNGHGTAVAGVIAALADNSIGGAGVCGSCSILPIKVMGPNGKGDLATVAAGIVRATDMGARVIDLSLGGPQGVDALKQATAYANSKGVLVVAAAGNSGLGVPFYPANYLNVLSVAGTDQRDRLYSWSERGKWVRITAPGCNVSPLLHGGYGRFCGTSSATPLVAGLAGLMLAESPHATSAQIAGAIQKTGRRIAASVQFGRINAAAALRAAAPYH